MKLSSGPRLSSACVRTTRAVYAPPAVSHKPIVSQKPLGERSGFTVALAAAVVLLDAWGWSGVLPAAAAGRASPPVSEAAERCAVTALDNFADTRAKFSQESSGGNMVEAIVDVRGCDFSGLDLSGKVFSAVKLQGANLQDAKVVGSQFARAEAQGAVLTGVDFTDANAYGTAFDGADLAGANFENAILTGATFGRDAAGNWANLKGTHFEGSLLSSSDITRICENPSLEESTKRYELGCRATK